jgi:hypothetical protein
LAASSLAGAFTYALLRRLAEPALSASYKWTAPAYLEATLFHFRRDDLA